MASNSQRPPPLPPRRSVRSPDVVHDSPLVQPLDDGALSGPPDTNNDNDVATLYEGEDELSEQQLRELYDTEEIERFLNLFSAYVTEVRLPDTPTTENIQQLEETIHGVSGSTVEGVLSEGEPENFEEGSWFPIDGSPKTTPSNTPTPSRPSDRCLTEEIAFRYLVPILPPAPIPAPLFTVGRLRLTTQRLYLAVEPVYAPFLLHLGRLATWTNKKESLVYCTIFWILWYQNLLLPALFVRIFYSLACRKLFAYPTLAELRDHRREIMRANEFGEEISARLSASSAFGMREMWRLFKVFNKSKKAKAKHLAKGKGKAKGNTQPKEDEGGAERVPVEEETGAATVLDDTRDTREERDFKRLALHSLSEIADFHERVKNIFIWRRPASSRLYGGVILLLFIITSLLPARYLAKLTYFVGGVLFWHVTPIVAALPPSERARLPPAFADVPTDADYAMELISQRVAAGLDVKPSRNRKQGNKQRSHATTVEDEFARRNEDGSVRAPGEEKDKNVDWKKWGERAALGKSWADDGKRLITGGQWPQNQTWPPRNPIIPQPALAHGLPDAPVETHTFPAQHNTAPGLITITPTTFFFTPLMSLNAKITIPISDLRGVKKTGMFKGVSLRWGETREGEKVEREERFRWVGGRDELFARLIGSDGRRWMKA